MSKVTKKPVKKKQVKKVKKIKVVSVPEIEIVKEIEKIPAKPNVDPNSTLTNEQKAGIPAVITTDSFEGVRKIDQLPLNQQIDAVFNPLHTITKTTVTQAVSESTYIVEPSKK